MVFLLMETIRFGVSNAPFFTKIGTSIGNKIKPESTNADGLEKKERISNIVCFAAEWMLVLSGYAGIAIMLEMMKFGVAYKNEFVKHFHDVDVAMFKHIYHQQALSHTAGNDENIIPSSKIYEQMAEALSHKYQNILSVEDINNIELLRKRDEPKLSGEQLLNELDPEMREDFNLICKRLYPLMTKISKHETISDMKKNWIRMIASRFVAAIKLTEEDLDKYFTDRMKAGLRNPKEDKLAAHILKSFSLQDIESLHLKEFKKALFEARKPFYVKRVEKQKKFLSLYDERFRC
jgi:hypothetical protein